MRGPAPVARAAAWRVGVSALALAIGVASQPAAGQTAAARLGARAARPTVPVQAPTAAPPRTGTMREALARQRASQSQAEQIRAYILSARNAAVEASRAPVADGLGAGGLDPTQAVAAALAAARAGDTAGANALLVSAAAVNDTTGTRTWEGAGLPAQSVVDGRTVVSIDQTQERALLSWNSFNVGANTTLQFNQRSNGVAQPGWVAVNRVTDAVAPSQILGRVTADGTVVVLNQSGIIFGRDAQVNTHSLLASTLELGNSARFVRGNSGATTSTTLAERNTAYLQNGLFLAANGTANALDANNRGAALLVSAPATGDGKQFRTDAGGITVDAGARIGTRAGGFLIMAAPSIDTAGQLSAVEGQVSLQAGYAVNYAQSTGAASDRDPDVRGYLLNSYAFAGQSVGSVVAGGLIESTRGYLSLGAGALGSVTVSGLLQTTTSVSRNGKISLTGGAVTLAGNADAARASGIAMLADGNGETIPQGSAASPSTFKASQLEIGTQLMQLPTLPVGALVPTRFTMGENALIVAPNADVSIGATTFTENAVGFLQRFPGSIDIAAGATIDVSGLKDVQLAASRNVIAVTPVKRNELRDTPNYREVVLDGDFTLNGATLYIDPRISGVREDGVRWVGSPLIEAGSLAAQVSITAAEFMTKGGTVQLLASPVLGSAAPNAATAASVRIAADATVDFSGGWVSYAAGPVRTSRLVTADGRYVDIANANPNDRYVAVAEGFTEVLPRFGVTRSFFNANAQGQRFDQAYDEGRDAGALTIFAPALSLDGTLYGNAFSGARQVIGGIRPGQASGRGGDPRLLQASPYQLASGGALAIGSQGDMLVYRGTRGLAESNRAQLLLSDATLSAAGLSSLSLVTQGGVTFAGANVSPAQPAGAVTITGASAVQLAPGGTLDVLAGSTIRFDGSVVAASGNITARTSNGTLAPVGAALSITGSGSVFNRGATPNYDIAVTGALSTAGLWVNDFATAGIAAGGAFADGGNISLTVQPSYFLLDPANQRRAIDYSGALTVSGLLDVSSGGYVTPTGGLVLTAAGGDVSLVNATVYASSQLTQSGLLSGDPTGATSDQPIAGSNQSVDFTSTSGGPLQVVPALVPAQRAVVDITGATIRGFGFGGGGTFRLVSPGIAFGADDRAGATRIGFDFLQNTGFGRLDLTANRSEIVADLFTNTQANASAFLRTERFVIGAGETLDLTQWVLPSILTPAQAIALRDLESGASLADQGFLSPIKPVAAFDQRAASLVLGGLTELDVLAGGSIVGAAGAGITASKLYNGGSIVLRGGSITQRNDVSDNLLIGGLGVRDAALGGNGLADAFGGGVDALGRFNENANNAAGVVDPSNRTRLLTNRQLVTREGADRLVYFLGLLGSEQGVLLADGSTTDLSGIAIFDPRTPFQVNGPQVRSGRVLDGGSISTAAARRLVRQQTVSVSLTRNVVATLDREDGAAVNISGSSALFDQAVSGGGFVPYLEWSKAGTISALGGGTLGDTPILARGGVAQAEGGTLEWWQPTVGTGPSAANYLSTDFITASGFDSLVARGSLRLDGDFSLALRKALMVTSQDALVANTPFGTDAAVNIGATAGTDATISAGYVRLASRIRTVTGSAPAATGGAEVRLLGRQGVDVVGGISFDNTIGTVTLASAGDLRLTGTSTALPGALPSYDGQLVAAGDLVLDARRTYATTGTGNLQALLEGLTTRNTSFDIQALGTHSITFGSTYLDAAATAPLSAGTRLRVLARTIAQNGYLAAPLGTLELGDATTTSLTFGSGSVTTVSGAGLTVPYGTTTDLIEYYFPTIGSPLTRLPTGQLVLTGGAIVEQAGARIDGRGGGDVLAYEFQSGVGGSRDVLDRFNRDAFSSNDYDPVTGVGYQFADRRQVFALVPASQAAGIAPFDPIFSADYDAAGPVNLYGNRAGLSVTLEAAPGIAGGEYLLVPARYAATIPGALRLVENTGAEAPLPGSSTTLLDGSVIVGGTLNFAGTGIAESTRRSFTVQSKDTFLRYSQIVTTSGTKAITDQAARRGIAVPRLPLDAARVILSPLTELRVAGVFDTAAASGGLGGEFDILGQAIAIVAEGATAPAGVLALTDTSLANLNATSLLIGGRRTTGADGTTTITASARTVDVAGGVSLQAPELLLAAGTRIAVADGATLAGAGTLGTQPASDYAVATSGALLRLSSGAERLVARTSTAGPGSIEIGAATLTGASLALDATGGFAIADRAALDARLIALSGSPLQFDAAAAAAAAPATPPGVIGAALEAKLAAAERLTLRSPGAIRFAAGEHRFRDLVLDTASLASVAGSAATDRVSIIAGNVNLLNSRANVSSCTILACGAAGTLEVTAAGVTFGNNAVSTFGFADGVTLRATAGMYVEGKGSFSVGAADLTLATPFLADRSPAADPRAQIRPDYAFLTAGAVTVSGTGLAGAPAGNGVPGARIAIGTADAPVLSATLENTLVRATAGVVDIRAAGDVSLRGATVSVPGFSRVFGDSVDAVTVSAGAGVINLASRAGDVRADAASTLIGDSGVASAGRINLVAANGTVALEAALNPGAAGPRRASLTIDSGRGSFDLDGFVTRYGARFGGDIAIRTGTGNLDLAAGRTMRARSVSLVADGGAITIGGTIDTSGASVAGLSADAARNADVNGGDIGLWGAAGVRLLGTARLDTHTTGYADADTRPASAGTVRIGIEDAAAAIAIEAGALIDVGARRTQAAVAAGLPAGRLVAQTITDPSTGTLRTVYTYAQPDVGGEVLLRTPVVGAAGNQVAVSLGGTIRGADSVQLEGFRRYDLDALVATGNYSGLSRDANGAIVLNMAQNAANSGGARNPFAEAFTLADGTPSLVRFIQDFGVSALDGTSLAGVRLRPGVELQSDGAIRSTAQWNLAAATFSPAQLQVAVDAGVLTVNAPLSTTGAPAYTVTTGREGELLGGFATFLYRVGGSAAGEAPVVTFRAGGDLTLERSVSDGFFTFRDKSDARYVSNQLGGTTLANSPLALLGNGAAGSSTVDGNGAGDALGFAELFPLLADGSAMHSSDIRLVGGAGAELSVDPLRVVPGAIGSVTVTGSYGYQLVATGATRPRPLGFGAANVAYVRSFVRTGDGAIAVAAATDVDVRGASTPVYRRANGTLATAGDSSGRQFNAAAIYTAGVRVADAPIAAQLNGSAVSIALDSPFLAIAPELAAFLPSPKALSDTSAVLAQGGGDLTVSAGRDVLGSEDRWSDAFLSTGSQFSGSSTISTAAIEGETIGVATQRWRLGQVGSDTEIAIAPRYFSSGLGTLAGGDVTIAAGRDVSQLTLALDSGATTTQLGTAGEPQVLLAFGSGNLSLTAGQDVLAGRFDVATGAASIVAERNVGAPAAAPTNYLRVRLTDAVVDTLARGSATIASVSALGPDQTATSAGYFSPTGNFLLRANEESRIAQTQENNTYGLLPTFLAPTAITPSEFAQILPPSLTMVSMIDSVVLPPNRRQLLFPSPIGQLRLFSQGDISQIVVAMSDADPALLAGPFSGSARIVSFPFPFVTANTTDETLRAQHNQNITHLNDPDPVRIYSNGDIAQTALFLPKQARVTAAGDIVDMFFSGQNVRASDITRVRAGGDITGTTISDPLPYVRSNDFILGGPGTFIVEAGRNLGPFVSSANITSPVDRITYSFGGGIRTIGNDYNPWLTAEGADLSVRFGMAAGADYAALRETYVNPANNALLDGDLFAQVTDAFGNVAPDRTRPIYALALADWLRSEAPELFAAVFGDNASQNADPLTGRNAEYEAAAYGRYADLYAQFTTLDPLRQQDFLINRVYFNELAQPGIATGPSYLQYVRGYRAVQTLFPPTLGYTDNLASYTTDPATVSADHPLGEPERLVVNGVPVSAPRVVTGNVDLRLATLQSARGGDVSILGPGGEVIAGSAVRTSEQASRRFTAFSPPRPDRLPPLESGNLFPTFAEGRFVSIPLGFEGVLTLRGGTVRSFTDGNFILNQSRVFTQQGGDVTMWSSNGDLNAGQGPKTAANFPPVTVRFDENGLAEVNSAGTVSGAGIGAFAPSLDLPPSNVILIAPVGLVDAGDAGVRASGNVVVAAARVANSDNFSAGGSITGVPSAAITASVATPNDAASAVAAQAANALNASQDQNGVRSLISVDVLGPLGTSGDDQKASRCPPGSDPTSAECRDER